MEIGQFCFRRFVQTLKWDIAVTWRHSLKLVMMMSAVLFLLYTFNPLAAEVHYGGKAPFVAFTFMVFSFVMPISLSRMLHSLRTKQQRIMFLSLPASGTEKFLVRLFHVTVHDALLFLCGWLIADLGQLVYSLADVGRGDSVLLTALRILPATLDGMWREEYAFDFMLVSAGIVLWLATLFVLFGTLFFRFAWFIAPVACMIVFTFLLNTVAGMVDPMHLPDASSAVWMMRLGGIAAILLAVGNLWLARCVFVRTQVINNKWINI